MSTTAEIIGVHKVRASQPVHLVEMLVRGSDAPFKIGHFTQTCPGKDESNWQVPYDDKLLSSDGTEILLDPWSRDSDSSPHWIGDVRIAFFFHFLNFDRPIITPFGDVPVPSASTRPARLRFLKYELP